MKAKDIKQKSVQELEQELIGKRQEQFNLRMQKGTGQLAQSHRVREVRRDIARIKTVLNEKAGS